MPDRERPAVKPWLSLGEAAQQLGVHPVTLRRWADAGEIGHMLTAGGHRRFALQEVRRFAAERLRNTQPQPCAEQAWLDTATVRTREVIRSHRSVPWMRVFDEHDRALSRALGRRLMAIILQYVSSGGRDTPEGFSPSPSPLLEEARVIGEQYARSAIEHGLPIATVLETTMSFRDALLDTAMLVTGGGAAQGYARLIRRINALLNTVQLAVARVYDAPAAPVKP